MVLDLLLVRIRHVIHRLLHRGGTGVDLARGAPGAALLEGTGVERGGAGRGAAGLGAAGAALLEGTGVERAAAGLGAAGLGAAGAALLEGTGVERAAAGLGA